MRISNTWSETILSEHVALNPPSELDSSVILSKDLMKLSFKDRNKVDEEIHGVRCTAVEETPELIQGALNEFDSQLNDRKEAEPGLKVLRNVIRTSVVHSINDPKSRCYLNDPDVRIRFLRKMYFVVDEAVQKFIDFLEYYSEIFGDFVAERPIQRSDFTTEEEKALKKSRVQFLPFRDRSGRRVCVIVGQANYQLETSTRIKIVLYQYWLVSRDVETQKKGLVLCSYLFEEGEENNNFFVNLMVKRKASSKTRDKINHRKLLLLIPFRLAAFHLYWPDTPLYRWASKLVIYAYPHETRRLIKNDFGTLTEIFYKISSFGVSVDTFPLTSSRSIKFANHCAWLDVMEKIEQGSFDKGVVDCPLLSDVVFRTGKTSRYNPGNAQYREVMQLCLHENSLRETKKKKKAPEIAKLVYDAIVQNHNGRFLEWWEKEKTWIILQDPEYVCKKIAKAFKNFKYKKGKRENPTKTIEKTLDSANGSVSALQEYYLEAHPSKRRKNCDCSGYSSSGDDSDGSCFGKSFFPVDE